MDGGPDHRRPEDPPQHRRPERLPPRPDYTLKRNSTRNRPRIDPLLPQPQGPWTRRVPELSDPDRHVYLAQIAVKKLKKVC